ncbi:MAG: sigma-E factor negative regulatory protein RseC [Oleiphilaceae bacterium]|jgi:sigma-E factor negative regulatory protein RseC
MAKELGKIESITDHYLLIETDLQSSCASCGVKSSCGQQVVGRKKNIKVPLSHSVGTIYSQGETVTLELKSSSLMQAALLLYLTPLFGLITSASVAIEIKLGELESIAFSFAGFFLGMVLAKKMIEKLQLTLHINKERVNNNEHNQS